MVKSSLLEPRNGGALVVGRPAAQEESVESDEDGLGLDGRPQGAQSGNRHSFHMQGAPLSTRNSPYPGDGKLGKSPEPYSLGWIFEGNSTI